MNTSHNTINSMTHHISSQYHQYFGDDGNAFLNQPVKDRRSSHLVLHLAAHDDRCTHAPCLRRGNRTAFFQGSAMFFSKQRWPHHVIWTLISGPLRLPCWMNSWFFESQVSDLAARNRWLTHSCRSCQMIQVVDPPKPCNSKKTSIFIYIIYIYIYPDYLDLDHIVVCTYACNCLHLPTSISILYLLISLLISLSTNAYFVDWRGYA